MSLGVSRSLGVSGYLWGTLDVFRCLWGTLDVFRCLWGTLDVFRCVWVSLGVSGGLWISSGLSGCLQVCLGLSGCLQVSLGDSGCLWGSLMVSGSLFFHSRSCCSIDALSSGAKWPLPFFICRIPLSLFFPLRLYYRAAPRCSLCVDGGYKGGRQRRTSPACIPLWKRLSVGAPDWGLERRLVSKLAHPSSVCMRETEPDSDGSDPPSSRQLPVTPAPPPQYRPGATHPPARRAVTPGRGWRERCSPRMKGRAPRRCADNSGVRTAA